MERRAAVLPGFVYFVSIHTRPTVVRGPAGEVYRDVTEATELLVSLGYLKALVITLALRREGVLEFFLDGLKYS